jgi:hypothetical protein
MFKYINNFYGGIKMKKLLLIASMFAFVSTSAFAMGGYAQLRGTYERISGTNNYGGGASIGLEMMPKVGIEGYFDYIHNPSVTGAVSGATATFKSNTMHFGGKVSFIPVDMLFIKAGAGMARVAQTLTISGTSSSSSGSDFEAVGNVGVAIPLSPMIAFTIEGQYTRIFSTVALNIFGGSAGVQFKF